MPLDRVQLGHFQLQDPIGQGRRGEIYVARDTRPQQEHRQLVIRVLRAPVQASAGDPATENGWRSRERELQGLTRLDHPHILPILEIGEEHLNNTKLLYFVMPLCSEGSFADWLQQRRGTQPLSFQEATYFIQQASAALQYLHDRRILHQDVTPASFLIRTWRGEVALPDLLLTNFGPAVPAVGTDASPVQGTPDYMAPEQWDGRAVPASDQYALAVIAYQLLTGRTPFRGTSKLLQHQHCFVSPQPPSMFNPAIPLALDAVLLRALAKKVEDRFPSVAAFSSAFEQAALQQSGLPDSRDPRSTRKIPALHSDKQARGTEIEADEQSVGAEALGGRAATGKHVVVVEGSIVPTLSGGASGRVPEETTVRSLAVAPLSRAVLVPFSPAPPSAPISVARRPKQRGLFLVLLLVLVLAVSGFLFAPSLFQKTSNGPGSNATSPAQDDGTGTLARGTPWVPVTVTPASTIGISLPGVTPTATSITQTTPTVIPTATSVVTPTPTPAPKPGSYTFEDGGTDGWVGLGTGVSNVKNTTTRAEQGTHSLSSTVYYTSGEAAPYVAAENSRGVGIPQPGQTVSVYVYPVAPGGSQSIQARLTVVDGAHTAWSGPLVTLRVNYWTYLVYPIPFSVKQQLVTCGVQFLTSPTKVSWTVMIDNMVWK